jgi:putative membrane protein
MYRFKEEELKKISNAVKKAEKKTSGEIVPFITNRAEDYFDGAAIFVFVAVMVATAFYFYYQPWHSVRGLLFSQLCGFLLGIVIVNFFPKTRLWFVSKKHIAKTTHRRAIQAFYENGLAKTRDKTGILLALFFLEKRVEVVADEAINSKLEQQTWDKVVETIVKNAKNRQFVEGFVGGIEQCGNILHEYFPRKKDDRNELKDNLIIS